MARKKEDNLIPGGHKFTREEASRGGKKSAQVRKERGKLRDLLADFLNSDCAENPQFEALAENLGLKSDESIKKLFVIACVINSAQKGNLDDISKLQGMLGEDIEDIGTTTEDDPLSKALKDEAKRLNEENSVESVENKEEGK